MITQHTHKSTTLCSITYIKFPLRYVLDEYPA